MTKNHVLRAISLFIAVCLLVINIPITTIALETDIEEPIPVYTIEDLYCIRDNLSANYILMNDIDLTEATAIGGDWDFEGRGWNPIGSDDIYAADKSFSGIFDGNGHEIIGMRINTSDSLPQGVTKVNAGLFSSISGEVKNLTLTKSNIKLEGHSKGYTVGSLAASNEGKISNCNVSGIIESSSANSNTGSGCVGGIAGYNCGTFLSCSSSVNIKAFGVTYTYSGGIAGSSYNESGSSTAFQSCSNEGSIYAYTFVTSTPQGIVTTYACSGGIVGQNSNGIISQCYNTGSVEADAGTSSSKYADFRAFAGGIAGSSENGTSNTYQAIIDSYNTGDIVTTASANYAGGIAGTCYVVENCYNIGNVIECRDGSSTSAGYGIAMTSHGSFKNCYYLSGSGGNYKDTTALTNAQMKLSSMFRGFDFDTVWQQNKNAEYPYPQLRSIPQNMEEAVQQIDIMSLPEKLSYYSGDELDLTGGSIQVTYTSGDTKEFPLSIEMISGYDPDHTGTQTLTVTYKGFTATFDVCVSDRPIATTISLIKEPSKTTFVQGTNFDLSGAEISVTYDNGETATLSVTDSMVSGGDISSLGEQSLIVSFEGLTLTIPVNVVPLKIEKLELTALPAKTAYLEGEELDTSGMLITAYYNNGESSIVSDGYTINGYSDKPGAHIITITYLDKSVSFTVTVKNKTFLKIAITQLPNKTEYVSGENLDLVGLIVTAIYDNGDTEEITDYEYSGFDSSVGRKTITVTYGEKAATFYVTVKEDTTTRICVDRVQGRPGETITVDVMIKNNPGFGGMAYDINYDSTVLELVSYELEIGNSICTDSGIDRYPDKMNFQYAGISNIEGDGVLASLTFRIKDSAPIGVAEISITPEEGTFFLYEDKTEVDFTVECSNGGIEIIQYIPGDINNDGKINNRDEARLMQYLAGWDVEVNELALDVNGDGKVNNRDAARISQYLAGWDVELY